MASSASTLPWLWVIETLASVKQVDPSILIELVKRTPEFSERLGEDAREMVFFRILESLASQQVVNSENVSSASNWVPEFDPSECCENVVRHMLRVISPSNQRVYETDMFKSKVQNFFTRKRESLRKCTLQKLKEAIVEGNHPILASLKKRIGSSTSSESKGRTGNFAEATGFRYGHAVAEGMNLNCPSEKTLDGLTQEVCRNRNLTPTKRGTSHLDGEDQALDPKDDYPSLVHGGIPLEPGGNLTSPSEEIPNAISQEGCRHIPLTPSGRNTCHLDCEGQALRSLDDCLSEPTGNLITSNDKTLKSLSLENSQKQNLTPLKRERSHLGGEGQALWSFHDYPSLVHGGNPLEAKGNLNSLSEEISNSLSQEGCQDLAPSKRDMSHLDGEDQCLRYSEDCLNLVHEDSPHLHISKKLKQVAASNGQALDLQPLSADKDGPTEALVGVSVNVAKAGGECFAEMGTAKAAPPIGIHENICGESKDKYENFPPKAVSGLPHAASHSNNFPCEALREMDRNQGQEGSCDGDEQTKKVDIAVEKYTFLSSQWKVTQDAFVPIDSMEHNLCMKCEQGGELLVCSAGDCPIVVHPSCLGSAPNFDDSGKFSCPFCSYSRAMSDYFEVKKKAILARQDIAVFLQFEKGHGSNKIPKKFTRPNQEKQDADLSRHDQANYEENHVNNFNNCQHRGNIGDKQQSEHSTSCFDGNLPSGVEGASGADGTFAVSKEVNEEGTKVGSECQFTVALEGQQLDTQACQNLGNSSPLPKETETDFVNSEYGATVLKDVSVQQAGCQQNLIAESSLGEEDDQPVSDFISRPLKKVTAHAYPAFPQLRRIPWTSEEEETLKEGVGRFSGDKVIKWSKILKFGIHVFKAGRTAGDLKDKWRNINKGSLRTNG